MISHIHEKITNDVFTRSIFPRMSNKSQLSAITASVVTLYGSVDHDRIIKWGSLKVKLFTVCKDSIMLQFSNNLL